MVDAVRDDGKTMSFCQSQYGQEMCFRVDRAARVTRVVDHEGSHCVIYLLLKVVKVHFPPSLRLQVVGRERDIFNSV